MSHFPHLPSITSFSRPTTVALHTAGVFLRDCTTALDERIFPALFLPTGLACGSACMSSLRDGLSEYVLAQFAEKAKACKTGLPTSLPRASTLGNRVVGFITFGCRRMGRFPPWAFRMLAFYVIPQIAMCFSKKVSIHSAGCVDMLNWIGNTLV